MAVVGGVLRAMMLGLDKGVADVTGVCALTPKKEDAEFAENEGAGCARGENDAKDDGVGEEMGVNAGFKTGVDEHSVTVTVAVDSIKTVGVPLAPVEVKTEMPLGTLVGARAGGDVGMAPKLKLDEGDVVGVTGESKGAELEGTIPPKLNVFVADVKVN